MLKGQKLLEAIGKDIFIDYYKHHSKEATACKFNISINQTKTLIKLSGYKKSKEDKLITLQNLPGGLEEYYKNRYNSRIAKYDSIEDYKAALAKASKDTHIKNYGSYDNYLKELKHSIQKTVSSRYGVSNISQLPEIKVKKKNTLIEHFGSLEEAYKVRNDKIKQTYLTQVGYEHNWQIPEVYEHRKLTWLEKYGVEYPLQSSEIREKCNETLQTRYGVKYACELPQVRYSRNAESGPNQQFRQLLESNDINYYQEFILDNYIYDFKINNYLIEINPYATHNCTWSIYPNSEPLSKYYHYNKSKYAFDKGYICLCIWDWINPLDIINGLMSKKFTNISFGEPRKFIYDIKKKLLTNSETKDTVIIYDDGVIIDA